MAGKDYIELSAASDTLEFAADFDLVATDTIALRVNRFVVGPSTTPFFEIDKPRPRSPHISIIEAKHFTCAKLMDVLAQIGVDESEVKVRE